METSAFFTKNPLPLFQHLSSDSKRQLVAYLATGNTAFRQKRVLEFFKTVDWVGSEGIQADRFFQKLPPQLKRQLQREIDDYQANRSITRHESAQKRAAYRLRIFEYFRLKMPPADKILLESLRDYELNLTGRDANWRHYFTFDSFKRIDAFIQASAQERQHLFAQFKQDVATYKKNYEKIHQAQQQAQANEHPFTFDDWCDVMGDENFFGTQSHHRHKQTQEKQDETSKTSASTGILGAYQLLNLDFPSPPEQVKQQFRKLTLAHHPDLPGGDEERMKALVNAYHDIKRYWNTLAQVH